MGKRILITGGGGFIGQYVTRALQARGDEVRILDSFIPQVHGSSHRLSCRDAEVQIGDIRDSEAVHKALRNVDGVIHLAAEVGVGQSMYAIDRYVSVNDLGTATLLQALTTCPVEKILVASSMSIYGEGLYRDAHGRHHESVSLPLSGWDPQGLNGEVLQPMPTPEWKRPVLSSVYALTKFTQEQMVLNVARAYGMGAVALRLFNVYGAGQALSNPYTGVLAIFAARLLNGKQPMIFEDGEQQRDFVHVEDVAEAFARALDAPNADGLALNIASGEARSIKSVALDMAKAMSRNLVPLTTQKRRAGDIRHCIADISLAQEVIGYSPRRHFQSSLVELAEWVSQQSAEDLTAQAARELETRGLVA